jgi:hypothetical protein
MTEQELTKAVDRLLFECAPERRGELENHWIQSPAFARI